MGKPNGEESIFDAARELPPGERASYFDKVCGGDAALRQRLERLLDSYERSSGFLEESSNLAARPTAFISVPLTERVGDRIDHYKLVQQIGEGGCGVVYLAEQEEPVQRRVALKLIKLGMDTKQVIVRFEAERQALALMDHPNIAKVLDGGATVTGRPYFVMELVQGIRITDYCDENNLPTRDGLNLFVQICRAIQHAHQKGIIHRDIKPSNILVTLHDGVPVPKVIDFGIAKATQGRLTDRTLFTAFEQFIGTPAYMSPEQAERSGLDIDTRSDVYSLGVLLYELLTGQTPFDANKLAASGFDAMRHTIREQEPERPSTRLSAMLKTDLTTMAKQRQIEALRLIHLVKGDLDWIVMKALEKDRTRRYETADGLARDIERHLKNEPVSAHAPSHLYRFGKFARRNKAALATATIIAVLLIVGVMVSTWQAVRATRAERVQRELRQQATERLWGSYLAQARANRWSGRAGRRFDSLDVLARAAALRPSLELRNEAIACMALADVRIAREWEGYPAGTHIVSFDDDLSRYARSDHKGNISVRRVSDDREIISLAGSGTPVEWVLRFSPDGRWLAAIYGNAGRLRVWDLRGGTAVLSLETGVHQAALDFSPDGNSIVVGQADGSIVFYDLPSGQQRKLPGSTVLAEPHTIRFSPAGGQLAISSATHNTVHVRDARDGQLLRSLPHNNAVRALGWHPGGRWLAAPCADGCVYVWDWATGQRSFVLPGDPNSVATHAAFSRGGHLLASTGWDGALHLWDAQTGKLLLTRTGGSACQFSRDDNLLGFTREGSKLSLLELAHTGELRTLGKGGANPSAADFAKDGRLMTSVCNEGVRLWDALAVNELCLIPSEHAFSALFHPDGKSLFTSGGSGLQRWPIKAEAGTNQLRLGPPEEFGSSRGFGVACLSRDGRRIIAAHGDDAHIYDLEQPANVVVLKSHPNVAFVSISPDNKWAATGTWKGSGVKVWDAQTGLLVRNLPVEGNANVAFSPDGKWLVSGASEAYRFWKVGVWDSAHAIGRVGAADLWGEMAFAPDGKMLAIAKSRGLIQLIEPNTGQELATLDAGPQTPLCFSPDGSELTVRGQHEYIQIWDLRLVRQGLAAMQLDWNLPAYPAKTESENSVGRKH